MEWKWTKGEPYERSKRQKHTSNDTIEYAAFSNTMNETAYSSSLNHDENTWDLLNQQSIDTEFRIDNKREDLDTKMSNRDQIQQIGNNPFLGENNYVEDISISDKFLKPINTTQGSTRTNQSSKSVTN